METKERASGKGPVIPGATWFTLGMVSVILFMAVMPKHKLVVNVTGRVDTIYIYRDTLMLYQFFHNIDSIPAPDTIRFTLPIRNV